MYHFGWAACDACNLLTLSTIPSHLFYPLTYFILPLILPYHFFPCNLFHPLIYFTILFILPFHLSYQPINFTIYFTVPFILPSHSFHPRIIYPPILFFPPTYFTLPFILTFIFFTIPFIPPFLPTPLALSSSPASPPLPIHQHLQQLLHTTVVFRTHLQHSSSDII